MSSGHFQEFEDEYLEMMYQFYEKDPDSRVRTGDLAEALRVTPASTTEMVQRLAIKGFLDYVPYKGSSLTEQGLIHGKKMKRRHRLAEVLLEHLPFDGNQHSTACRLEHAIDDDLEVALTIYLDNPVKDPSGTKIPSMSSDIEERVTKLNSGLSSLANLAVGSSGVVKIIALGKLDTDLVKQFNITIGDMVSKTGDSSYQCNDSDIQLHDDIAAKMIISQ
ncbi:MAG: metal-dependent transcriptional regulator [Euryarchaeota archaeon]|nr:metal-dependent transcriptional regulator [Euryarchaeota archaeon]MBT7986640.1 metal-dependent transcriptional regulator [Euryarchaeota archaeon]